MDGAFIILLLALGGACIFLQTIAIVRLVALRKLHGGQRKLDQRPDVKVWMKRSRLATLIAAISAFAIAYLSHGSPVFVILLFLSVALLMAAATVSDNSTEHGDGDSGG